MQKNDLADCDATDSVLGTGAAVELVQVACILQHLGRGNVLTPF
jgi:hypothetical protein